MTRSLTYVEALREGMRQEMERDETVFVMGEGVGLRGSAFKQTAGFYDQFGPERVRDTAISELAIAGAAVGAAISGMRPIADLMWIDFTTLACDQICNQAAKLHYVSNGQIKVPAVFRATTGGDMDDARAFLGADIAPRHDPVGIIGFGKRRLNLRQIIEDDCTPFYKIELMPDDLVIFRPRSASTALAPDIRLPEWSEEKAREVAREKGRDYHALRSDWMAFAKAETAKGNPPKNAGAAFVAYCKKQENLRR